jgi:hypothetical protein
VPVGATGVLLNVTVVSPSAAGFLSVRPGDATGAPKTSSLNFAANATVPNSVQVALPTAGANAGQIDITYDALGVAGPTTDVLVDVVGYVVVGVGATGPAGPQGPVGPAGPVNVRWAKIGASTSPPTVLSGVGVVGVARVGSGQFRITFNSSVVGCGWMATYNDNDEGGAGTRYVTVERAKTTENDLVVQTFDIGGTAADPLTDPGGNDGFSVMAICP